MTDHLQQPNAEIHTPDARRLTSSPWGTIQNVTQLAPGIWLVSTASHGGIKVSDQRLATMHPDWRQTAYSSNGWFEEDCDWALVALSFPDAFKPEDIEAARRTVAHFHPKLVPPLAAI